MKAPDGYVVGKKVKKKRVSGEGGHASFSFFNKEILSFLRFEDNLNDEQVSLDILKALLNSQDLDSDIDRLSVGYSLISTLASYARERAEKTKLSKKEILGTLLQKAQDGEMTGRISDVKLKIWMESHPDFIRISKIHLRHVRQAEILEGVVQALEIRSRMLQTKSANIRSLNNKLDRDPISLDSGMSFKKRKNSEEED